MQIIPRDYQTEAIQSIFTYFATHSGNPVIAKPTGTGKSIVIAGFLEIVYQHYPNQKVLVLTHVKELIEQNYDKLLRLWPQAPAGIYSAGLNRRDIMHSIIFGGVASVIGKHELFGHVDLVIVDEAHLVSPDKKTMYRKFITELSKVNPALKVIGLTATPWRLGHGLITKDNLFTDFCFDITGLEAFNRLIGEGYLSSLVPKKTKSELDISGVHMRGGEFIESELQQAVDREEVTYAALKETMEEGADRDKWLIFTSGIKHSVHAAEMLNSLGIPCGTVHSKMSSKDRAETLAAFRDGRLRAVTNNNVLTTGFDLPEIDLICMLRPTASAILWIQMLGRGTRPVYAEGFDLTTIEGRLAAIQEGGKQNCLVLDFAGNTRRLGPINDPVIPKRKGKKGGDAPVKLCEACGTYNHASVRHCVQCGAEFQFIVKLRQEASTDDLIKGDLPVIESYKVDHITYTKHTKHNGSVSMKVSYYCNLRSFKEFVCIGYSGFPLRKAKAWWAERSDLPLPETVDDGLQLVTHLKAPTHIRVWVNKKYPEIMTCCYDGSDFGSAEPDPFAVPTIANDTIKTTNTPSEDYTDDDIPF